MYLFGFHYLFSSILIYLDESVKPILNVESDIFIIRDALTLKLRFPHWFLGWVSHADNPLVHRQLCSPTISFPVSVFPFSVASH